MKKLMSYTMIALLATVAVSIAASDKDEIMAKEKAAWQAFKDKDADAFKKLISSDLATVTSDRMHNLEQELEMMGKTKMKSFDLSDFNVTFPIRKTAILTYKATVDATLRERMPPAPIMLVPFGKWPKGTWHGVFHAEAKAESAAKSGG